MYRSAMRPLRASCSLMAQRPAHGSGASTLPARRSAAAAAATPWTRVRQYCPNGAIAAWQTVVGRGSTITAGARRSNDAPVSSSAGKGFGTTPSSGKSPTSGGSSGSSGGRSGSAQSGGSGGAATPNGGRSAGRTAAAGSAAPSAGGAGDMYLQPQLYDEVFGYRDFGEEAAFVRAAYARHCGGQELGSVLELGCGPARHAALLAQGGTRVWALDASRPMLDYAAQLAARAGADVALVEGDMTSFALEGQEGKLDAVVCLLGTFSHMITNDMAAAAFSCAARHLRPGGMLLLELAHPGDLFDGSLLIGDEGGEMWEVESASQGGKLLVEWGAEGDDFDAATQVLARSVSVARMQDGDMGDAVHASVVRQRAFTLQELDLLGRLAGLRLAASYGDLDLKVGLTHEDAYRLVAVLVKGGAGGA